MFYRPGLKLQLRYFFPSQHMDVKAGNATKVQTSKCLLKQMP